MQLTGMQIESFFQQLNFKYSIFPPAPLMSSHGNPVNRNDTKNPPPPHVIPWFGLSHEVLTKCEPRAPGACLTLSCHPVACLSHEVLTKCEPRDPGVCFFLLQHQTRKQQIIKHNYHPHRHTGGGRYPLRSHTRTQHIRCVK